MEAAQKRGQEELGRGHGGLTTKVHAVVDGLGNPIAAFPPEMKNMLTYFLLLLFLPPFSFGLLEFEDAL